jgi:hypothetical protein
LLGLRCIEADELRASPTRIISGSVRQTLQLAKECVDAESGRGTSFVDATDVGVQLVAPVNELSMQR